MKNKGFTLVELLGVIVILAIIFILVFPSVKNITSQSRETVYNIQINKILTATYDLTLKNPSYLPNYNEKTFITLSELKINGLIDFNIKDPKINKNFPDNLVISIHNVGLGYKNSNTNSKLEGDYLYTVELEKLEDETHKDLLPKIILEGNDLKRNSNGNYIMLLNLNQNLPNIKSSAISYKKEDLTNKLKQYIILNDNVVENIDSSKSSIYKIIYSVVDKEGYANEVTLNIIIADTTYPSLTFEENTIINKNIKNYDLLKNVFCEDNSGFCDIGYTAEEEFYLGTPGKYIINYTAKDPSGNTTSKKRVITIE